MKNQTDYEEISVEEQFRLAEAELQEALKEFPAGKSISNGVDVDVTITTITPETVLEVSSRCKSVFDILKGIIKKAEKGQLNRIEKDYILSQLSQCYKRLDEIDVDVAVQEANRRKAMYSKIADRL